MRTLSLLLLLVLVVCVLPSAWSICTPCIDDSSSKFGDGCSGSPSCVEAGYICHSIGSSESQCTLSPGGIQRGNTAANLLFQSNFNYGIFDISKTDGSQLDFTLQLNYDISKCSQGIGSNTKSGYCTFTGASNAYITSALPTGSGTARTLCAWLYPATTSGTHTAVYYGATKALAIGVESGKFIVSNGDATLVTGSTTPTTNTWYHVCATLSTDETTATLYVNKVADGTAAYTAPGAHSSELRIGSDGSDAWNGRIFDVRIVAAASLATVAGIYDENAANKAAFNKVTPGCGDGIVDPTEDCDDNNVNDNDGCDKFCKIESQYTCTGSPSVCYEASLNEFTAGGATEDELAFPDGASYANYRPTAPGGDLFYGSVLSSATSSIDTSKLGSWVPSVSQSRSGEFTYTIHGLNPSGTYKVDFVFAETKFTTVGQRVFKVNVQGEQPNWSPVDIIAAAGKINTAIGRSVTAVADNAGAIVVSFTNNAIVQAVRYSPVSYQVAAFSSGSDVLTVEGSDSGSGVFNPAKGYPSFSIEAYVYSNTLNDFTVVGKGATEFGLEYDSGAAKFKCIFGSTTLYSRQDVFEIGQWYHVVCTKDATARTAYIYINGVQDSQGPASPEGWTPTTTALTFGADLDGYLDSVRLWERALTHNEIFARAFSNAPSISYFGLVEEWTFDSPTNAYKAFGTLGQSATAASFPDDTDCWFDHATPAIVVAIDVGSSVSTLDTATSTFYHADNFFNGGSMVSTGVATIANGGAVPQAVLKTGRSGGDFTYNIRGLVPQQSYLLEIHSVEYTAASAYDVWVQGVKVSVAASLPISKSYPLSYTSLADFAGKVNIKFGDGASVAAITLTPQVAPVGSVRFFTVDNIAPFSLAYESTLVSKLDLTGPDTITYSVLDETTELLNTPTPVTAFKSPSTSTPFSSAVEVNDDTNIIITDLFPGEIYYVQVFFIGVDTSGSTYTVESDSNTYNTISLDDSTNPAVSTSVIFIEAADENGKITYNFARDSGSFYLSAIQILEGPRVFIPEEGENIPQGSKTVTVAGANFNLMVALGKYNVKKSTFGTVVPVNVYPYFDYLVFDFTGKTLATGAVDLALKISDSSVDIVLPDAKPLGFIVGAPTLSISTNNVAANAQRLVISGSNLYGEIAVWLTPTAGSSSFNPVTDVACKINSFSADKIVCTPASTLAHGDLYAVLQTFGTTNVGVKIGVVVSAPTITSVSRVYAESSTLVINGKGFIASPNHGQNNVVITQQSSSRKRSVGARDLLSTPTPSCTVISATTTQIICALSNVVAGSISVSVGTGSGFSAATVAIVQVTMPGQCVPPRGAPDATDSSLCNCWSGYAPSSSAFSDCSVSPICPRRNVDSSSSGPSMSQPTTSFSADKLIIKQTSPIVANRRDTTIRFSVPTGITGGYTPVTAVLGAPGSVSCGYPGNLWVKTIDASECLDVFTAYIPWSVHTLCGFIQLNSSTANALFQTQMDTTYVSANLINGAYVQRVTTDSYIVSVKFAKTLSFTSNFNTEFAESSANDFVNVLVDATVYDPAVRILTVYLTVESTWPYMINAAQLIAGVYVPGSTQLSVLPSDVSANLTGNADSEISDVISCSTQTNSVCGQMMIAKILITNATLCDIAGGYKFDNTPLLCRDITLGGPCGTVQPTTNLYFEIADTNLCNDDAVNPSASMSSVLLSYPDHTMSTPQTTFFSSDVIYFSLSVVSPFATVDSVTLAKVDVSNDDTGTDAVYENNGGSPPYEKIFTIAFESHDNYTVAPPGTPVTISFGFRLSPESFTQTLLLLREINTASSPLKISVTANINFHGNDNKKRKRSLTSTADDFEMNDQISSTTVSALHNIHFYHKERSPEEMVMDNKPIQSEYDQPPNAINNNEAVAPPKSIWADLIESKSEIGNDLGPWFEALESGADTLLVKSLVIFLGCLLVHIIA